MSQTSNLKLALTAPEEWPTKKYKDFILELAGVDDTSNMQVIDNAIGSLRATLDAIDTQLSSL